MTSTLSYSRYRARICASLPTSPHPGRLCGREVRADEIVCQSVIGLVQGAALAEAESGDARMW